MGYEIHMGSSTVPAGSQLFSVLARNKKACSDTDGCRSADGRVLGTYIHGLFDRPAITRKWLDTIGLHSVALLLDPTQGHGPDERDQAYEQLAEHALAHLDMQAICALLPPALRKCI
jgi:adenosylcobyric acid synthase